MDACYDYELNIILFEGNANPRDLSPGPGDCIPNKIYEGTFLPTTLRPKEEPKSSQGKGPRDHDQSRPTTGLERNEVPTSKNSIQSKAVRSNTSSPGTLDSGAQPSPANRHTLVTPTRDMVEPTTVVI